MSKRERDRLAVLRPVVEGRRTTGQAAGLLGLSGRQVRRLAAALRARGDAGLVHGLRGRPSNRRTEEGVRERALGLYRVSMGDYGPTLASERLAEAYGVAVTPQTLRRWLLAEGLWSGRRKREKHRVRRPRRACVGQMLQADASHHDWLEGRGVGRVVLVAMIDDASSRVFARFYEGETTAAYMDLLGRYCRAYGVPASLYTDRAGIFRTERRKRETDTEKVPQFTRALGELGVRLLVAQSPQAKGRIERFFGTAQDRWVKALREAGACTLAQANRVAERRLLGEFNTRFTVRASASGDGHRPCPPAETLAAALCVQEHRVVGNDYTVRHANRVYQLLPPAWPGLRGGKVVVEEREDGVRLRFKGRYLEWKPAASRAPSAMADGARVGGPF